MAQRNGMARLRMLYGMMEQMRSLERRVAASAVDEIDCAAAIEAMIRETYVSGGRSALGEGDRAEWMIAEKVRDCAEARMERLAKLRVERAATLEDAVDVHRESRLKMEQMERLVARMRAGEVVEDERREQARSDDRFGSRLAWSRLRQAWDAE